MDLRPSLQSSRWYSRDSGRGSLSFAQNGPKRACPFPSCHVDSDPTPPVQKLSWSPVPGPRPEPARYLLWYTVGNLDLVSPLALLNKAFLNATRPSGRSLTYSLVAFINALDRFTGPRQIPRGLLSGSCVLRQTRTQVGTGSRSQSGHNQVAHLAGVAGFRMPLDIILSTRNCVGTLYRPVPLLRCLSTDVLV